MPKSLIVIDSRIHNYQSLLAGMDSDMEVVILEENHDGVLQIADYLYGRSEYDAIHILSHGSQGSLYLGSTTLTNLTLANYVSQLNQIGSSLIETGDIILYGCNVAEGYSGHKFINALAQVTGADITASVNSTGAEWLGGDWVLEESVGSIEAITIQPLIDSGLLVSNTAPSFPADGFTTTAIGVGNDFFESLAIQGDGKILAVGGSSGDFAMIRYHTDGSLDTSFDGDGKVITDLGSASDYASDVAIQNDGKIILSGKATTTALARYNSDGSLDTSFGFDASGYNGDGTMTYHEFTNGSGVVIQADGAILAGQYGGGINQFAVFKYSSSGAELGKYYTYVGQSSYIAGWGDGLILQSDGKILAAGYSSEGISNSFAVVRFNTDGTLDSSFDGDGKVTTDIGPSHDMGASIAVQSDGKILVAGIYGTNFALVRYNTDGSLDSTFDSDGKVTTAIGSGSAAGKSVAIQSDGKILVAGHSHNGSNSDFALVRYNTDGSLDTTFDTDGMVTTAIGLGDDVGSRVAIQSDGKILVAGTSHNGSDNDSALVRYNIDGSLDTSFDVPSNGLNAKAAYTENTAPVVLDNNVSVYDAELASLGHYAGARITLSRHGGPNSDDLFSSTGNLSALSQGSVLVLSGKIIGTVTNNSGGTLTITFNNNATQARVNETLSSLTYANNSDNPSASVQIDWIFSDGNAGAQGTGGALTTTGNTAIIITPVNDAPTGSNSTLTVSKNDTHILT